MFLDFLTFEIKLRLRNISTYCYFGLWFILTFLFVAAPDFFVGPGKVLVNGPFITIIFDVQFAFFGSIIMAAIFGTSILRDFQRDTYQLVFTKPITKFAYLAGC
jgi:ABC-2 type transport system permease protein